MLKYGSPLRSLEPMLTLAIWWSGIALESAIMLRGLQQKTTRKYPFFYLYVASLLFADAFLYVLSRVSPAVYPKWNWDAGFLNIILSCGILLEIFKHVLTPYPGAERFARISGLVIFALIFSFGIVYLIFAPPAFDPGQMASARNLERNLLAVQAIFLSSLVAVICYYAIPMTRNLQGMIIGYGWCVGTTLTTLAIRTFAGSSFNAAWILIQPLAYWISLFVWLVALWNYSPSIESVTAGAEPEYHSFVTATRSWIGEMRSHLGRAARP